MTGALVPVRDPALVSELRRRAERLVDDDEGFRPDVIHARGWAVAPVESALHFDREDATRLAGAIGSDVDEIYAVAIEDLQSIEPAYCVPATVEGLLRFSSECGLFSYLLLPPEPETFAVLCSVADYCLLAGTLQFVEEACGADIVAARETFAEFASDHGFSPEKRARMNRFVTMYRASD